MKDETFVFISDVKEKGSIGRSARHRKTHAGKGGKVRLPSDNLSKKELIKMSGECKSYRLNEPMSWKEFKSMPDDIKVTYIKLLRQKFKVPDCKVGEMLGVDKHKMSYEIKRIGLGHGEKHGGYRGWDKDGFYAWMHGVEQTSEQIPVEHEPEPIKEAVITSEEPETFMVEDIPAYTNEPVPVEEYKPIPATAIPCNGSMNFNCPADQALNTMAQILGNANVSISFMWRVIEDKEQGE